MSNMFSKFKTDGLEETQDRTGGFTPLNSNIYDVKVKALYAGKSPKGAESMTLIGILPDGKEYRETLYITNRNGENWFLNKDDRTKKVPLPGFTVINDLCMAATGEPLCEQEGVEKVFNVYDKEAKKELPKTVMMVAGVLDQTVSLAILNELRNKSEQVGTEYVDIPETRNANVIDKVFHTESKMSMAEALNNREPEFWDKWLTANKDQVRDKRTIKDGQAPAGGPPKAGASAPAAGEKKSLFPKK